MGKYLLRRLNLFVATSLVLAGVLFYTTGLFPVDRITALSGIVSPSPAQVEQVTELYALNKNTPLQFSAFLQQRLSGDLGISITSQQSVSQELMARLPATLELANVAALLALVFGVPIGILASLTQHRLTQHAIMAMTLTGYSIPVFWLGLTLSLWFGVHLGWLPISGQINLLYEIEPVTGFILFDTWVSDSEYRMAAFLDAIQHMILPSITLAVLPFTVVVRITRSAMLNIMNQTFIRAAEARGLSTAKIVLRHALPNALIPVLKHLGIMLGPFASYSIIVEVIFSWPGVGSWLVSGIYQRDYTVIQGGILVVALLIMLSSILIEIVHTATNPISRKELYASN